MLQGLSYADRAVVRACLRNVLSDMSEAREVRSWWGTLPDVDRAEWKLFQSGVEGKLRALTEPTEAHAAGRNDV